MRRSTCWLVFASCLLAAPAQASEPVSTSSTDTAPLPVAVRADEGRPTGLFAFYVAHAALQSLDVYSTLEGARGGASEQNPVVRGFAEHPTAFILLKGAVSATTIMTAERLWQRGQRRRALALMAVSNGLMAVVAANNAAVLRR